MRKLYLHFSSLLVLLIVAGATNAAPILNADAMPNTGPQPSSAAIIVNGAAGPPCTLVRNADDSVRASCDLASLTAPGTYTIVMTYTYTRGCVNAANQATCTDGGVASSAPFILKRVVAPAVGPVLRVDP